MSGDRGLGILNRRKLTWRLPEDPVADEVLIPGLRCADGFDCMVGFFGGRALRQLAPGLASYISRAAAPMRLLVSPVLTENDLAAVRTGTTMPADAIADALGVALHDETALSDALAAHTLECLAYLLASERLEMRVVLIDGGVFHLKEWILHAGGDIAVLSGSANFTNQALTSNFESLHLHRSWRDRDNLDTCRESASEFELLWNGRKPGASTFDLPSAIADDLITTYAKGEPPTEADFHRARAATDPDPADPGPAQATGDAGDIQTAVESPFHIPGRLDIYRGAYAHQGRAIEAWEDNGRRGILAMATGAGKTITALAAAKRLQEHRSRLLIVISVPTRPLLAQWQHECTEFGLKPVVAPTLVKPKRLHRVQLAIDNLELRVTDAEAIISTDAGLVEPDLNRLIAAFDGPVLLISDEVHNLGGAKTFLEDPPVWAEARLGLSATPVRQYDDDGTRQLFDYFGDVVFEFGLEDAIGVCLLPYDYLLHRVRMTDDEAEQYTDLSRLIGRHIARSAGNAGIGRIDGRSEPDETSLTYLLNQRRLLVETASGKLRVLESLLDEAGPNSIRRTLFYATDKDPDQLAAVNGILRSRRIRSHQITEAETSRGKLMAEVLRAFESGVLHALTAKRVLDEGLNVPQINTAYLLASTTVEKQWVQRRGRVLRPSPETGKTHATIHDFVVLPPERDCKDRQVAGFLKGELARCDEFARLARNRAERNGPYAIINNIRYEYPA